MNITQVGWLPAAVALALSLSLASSEPASAQVGPPGGVAPTADADSHGPPCCTTPAIIEELSARPVGESRTQLAAWLGERTRQAAPDEVDIDIAALRFACEAGCPANFREGRAILQQIRGGMQGPEIDTDPCCTPRSNAPISTAHPAGSRRTTDQANPAQARQETLFADALLLQLRNWTRSPDEVPLWLPPQLPRLGLPRLRALGHNLTALCSVERCSRALLLGSGAVEDEFRDRTQREADRRDAVQREQEQDARWTERQEDKSARFVTWIISLLSVLVALIAVIAGLWQARIQSRSLETVIAGWRASFESAPKIARKPVNKPRVAKNRSPRASWES